MAREANGWGTCVNCGEMLTPEDAEELGWSDRCRMCLELIDVWDCVNPRIQYIKKQLKTCSSPEWKKEHGETGEAHWQKKLEMYEGITKHLQEIKKLKAKEDWKACYPTSTKPIRRSR